MSDEYVPFAQQFLESKKAKVIGEQLEKSKAKKKAEIAEEARRRVMAGVDPSRWALVTRRDGAVRAAVQAAHAAKTAAAHPAPEEKPRTRWKFVPSPGQIIRVTLPDGVCTDPSCEKHKYAKILDWGAGGVRTVSKDGHIDALWADVRPVPERELERRALAQDEDIEQQGVRLSRFSFTEDLADGMLAQVGPNDWTHARGRVVYIAPKSSPYQFAVLKTADHRFIAFLPWEIQIVPREDGSLPE